MNHSCSGILWHRCGCHKEDGTQLRQTLRDAQANPWSPNGWQKHTYISTQNTHVNTVMGNNKHNTDTNTLSLTDTDMKWDSSGARERPLIETLSSQTRGLGFMESVRENTGWLRKLTKVRTPVGAISTFIISQSPQPWASHANKCPRVHADRPGVTGLMAYQCSSPRLQHSFLPNTVTSLETPWGGGKWHLPLGVGLEHIQHHPS